MASRTTLKAAQELKEQMQARHPGIVLRIEDNSKAMRIGRGAARSEGFEILEDTGAIMVLAQVSRFDVVEVRHCSCGAEITTIAIGEAGLDECASCRRERELRNEQYHEDRSARQAHSVREWAARDEGEES